MTQDKKKKEITIDLEKFVKQSESLADFAGSISSNLDTYLEDESQLLLKEILAEGLNLSIGVHPDSRELYVIGGSGDLNMRDELLSKLFLDALDDDDTSKEDKHTIGLFLEKWAQKFKSA